MQLKTVLKNGFKGIAAIEVMVVIAVLFATFSIAIPLFFQAYPVNRANETTKRLIDLKNAMVGDASLMVDKKRVSFGFVGDLGILPVNLGELVANSQGRPAYQQYGSTGMFYGWKGPYVKDANALKDAWGDDIAFNTINEVDPVNGRLRIREIVSGNLDASRIVYIYEDEVSDFVTGGMVTRLRPHTVDTTQSDTVYIFYPNGTGVTQSSFNITNGVYNTQTGGNVRIPVGYRHVQLQSGGQLLAALNGFGNGIVNFIGTGSSSPSPSYDESFDSEDDIIINDNDSSHTDHHIKIITVNDGVANLLDGSALYAHGNKHDSATFVPEVASKISDLVKPGKAFTLSIWMYMPFFKNNESYVIISQYLYDKKDNIDRGWKLRVDFPVHGIPSVKFTFAQDSTHKLEIQNDNQYNGATLVENKWYHVCVVYDGTSYSGSTKINASALKIYVTALDIAHVNVTPTLTVLSETLYANNNTDCGCDLLLCNEANGDSPFWGYLDEFKIFGTALSTAEVETLFRLR
ncbi:MAG: LamG-like jellyroll fold domain-containing protein [Candidatus Omnitrophota bacterium]